VAENPASKVTFSTQFCGGKPLRMRNLQRMRIVQNALVPMNWRREGRLGLVSARVARRPAKGGHVLLFGLMSSIQQANLKTRKMSGFLYIFCIWLLALILWQF